MIKDLWVERRKILKEIEMKNRNSPIDQINLGQDTNTRLSRSDPGPRSKKTQGYLDRIQKRRNLSKG